MLQHPDISKMELYGSLNDEEPVYYCDNCGEEIYSGDKYYNIEFNGMSIKICPSCIIECRQWA